MKEATVNLAVAQAAAAQLEAFGVKVVLTRTADTYSTLASRARIATSLAPNAFVSIHHNGAPDHDDDRPGTEVYYQADDERSSKRLAGLIYEEVTAALAPQQLRWGWYADAGVKVRLNDQGGDYYGILRNAAGVPSALAELSYLTKPAEEALLKTPEFQKLEGAAVARGILRFLTTDDPGSGYVGPSKRTDAATGGGSTGCVDPPLQ
jgi:N-acetylmuramoyl-L-alanine amidase